VPSIVLPFVVSLRTRSRFIKFANGIINETNTLIATVMQKLPEIRMRKEKMKGMMFRNRVVCRKTNRVRFSSRLDDNG
jgi:hypothetical protein